MMSRNEDSNNPGTDYLIIRALISPNPSSEALALLQGRKFGEGFKQNFGVAGRYHAEVGQSINYIQ